MRWFVCGGQSGNMVADDEYRRLGFRLATMGTLWFTSHKKLVCILRIIPENLTPSALVILLLYDII